MKSRDEAINEKLQYGTDFTNEQSKLEKTGHPLHD